MTYHQQDPWLGQVLGEPGRYRLESLLGQGGMGKVYKALDLQDLGGSYPYRALKIMSVDGAVATESQRRFAREMKACLHIHDQRIVQALDFGIAALTLAGIPQELPYLVMELISGPTLFQVLQESSPLTWERALDLGVQIAQALHVIHQGVMIDGRPVQFIHRDLKPSNLFVVQQQGVEQIKLADFGLVKLIGDLTQSKLTRTGAFAGSPAYASPEQCQGSRTIDARTDQYSLGCILYQMLMGTNLFGITQRGNPIVWIQAHIDSQPRPFDPTLQIPEEVERLVMRCLEKDPDHRFATIADLIDALMRVRQQIKPCAERQPVADPAPDNLIDLLNPYLNPRGIQAQIKQKGGKLQIMLNRSTVQLPEPEQLTRWITTQIEKLYDPTELEEIILYSRQLGQKQPDWQHPLSLKQDQPAEILESLRSDQETHNLKNDLQLEDYCFTHNPLMLTFSLPDPEIEVAEAVQFFHDLSYADKAMLLPLMTDFFLPDPRQIRRDQFQAARNALPQSLQQWLDTLESFNDRELKSTAIWLSRYCKEPEKTLARVNASFLTAQIAEQVAKEEAQNKTKTRSTSLKQLYPLKDRPERKVVSLQKHGLILLWPLLVFIIQILIAVAISSNEMEIFNIVPFVLIGPFLAMIPFAFFQEYISELFYFLRWNFFSVTMTAVVLVLAPFSMNFVTGEVILPQQGLYGLIGLNCIIHTCLLIEQWRKPLVTLSSWNQIEVNAIFWVHKQCLGLDFEEIASVHYVQEGLGSLLGYGTLVIERTSGRIHRIQQITGGKQLQSTFDQQKRWAEQRQRPRATPTQMDLQSQQDPWLHHQIGEQERYRLDALIGIGGMSRVYRAFDQQSLLTVAIKLMSGRLATDPRSLDRFQREMQACVHLRDRRILKILNYGVIAKGVTPLPYLVMEYIQAPTLAQVLKRQPHWPIPRVIHLAQEIALALDRVHQGMVYQGKQFRFIHRDVKPSNIFLLKGDTGQETVKLADFGIVKTQGSQESSLRSGTGEFIGTARYASPEQCQGMESIDARSDLYSLGCILYEILAGVDPFDLSAEAGTMQFLYAHISHSPRPFPTHLGIPQPLAALVYQCLEKDLDQRFSSAQELYQALLDLER